MQNNNPQKEPADLFQKAKEAERQLMENLHNAEISELVGIVHASGAYGMNYAKEGEDNWKLRFTLEPWRFSGGPILEYPLDVCQDVSKAELKEAMQPIKEYDILRIRAKVEENTPNHKIGAILIDLLGKETSNLEMLARSEELQKPVTIVDEFFGQFTLNRRLNSYETTTAWKSSTVGLVIIVEEGEYPLPLFAMARSLWKPQNIWDERVYDCAVEELLELKNDSWLEEDEKEITPEQFKNRMSLSSITLYSGGWTQFWFDDGDLFWRHSIMVSGKLSEGPTDAGIEG